MNRNKRKITALDLASRIFNWQAAVTKMLENMYWTLTCLLRLWIQTQKPTTSSKLKTALDDADYGRALFNICPFGVLVMNPKSYKNVEDNELSNITGAVMVPHLTNSILGGKNKNSKQNNQTVNDKRKLAEKDAQQFVNRFSMTDMSPEKLKTIMYRKLAEENRDDEYTAFFQTEFELGQRKIQEADLKYKEAAKTMRTLKDLENQEKTEKMKEFTRKKRKTKKHHQARKSKGQRYKEEKSEQDNDEEIIPDVNADNDQQCNVDHTTGTCCFDAFSLYFLFYFVALK